MGFEIPQLDSCCCGCTLKTGTKIIGWLQLIGAITFLVASIMYFIALSASENQHNSISVSLNGHKNQLSGNINLSDINKKDHLYITVLKIITAIMVVMSLLYCVLAFVLLMGVYQHKPNLVYTWVITSLWMDIISTLLNVGESFHNVASIGSTLTMLVISLYFILVVYSYYRSIRNQPSNV